MTDVSEDDNGMMNISPSDVCVILQNIEWLENVKFEAELVDHDNLVSLSVTGDADGKTIRIIMATFPKELAEQLQHVLAKVVPTKFILPGGGLIQ